MSCVSARPGWRSRPEAFDITEAGNQLAALIHAEHTHPRPPHERKSAAPAYATDVGHQSDRRPCITGQGAGW